MLRDFRFDRSKIMLRDFRPGQIVGISLKELYDTFGEQLDCGCKIEYICENENQDGEFENEYYHLVDDAARLLGLDGEEWKITDIDDLGSPKGKRYYLVNCYDEVTNFWLSWQEFDVAVFGQVE